ncbi:MAG: riboflavin synthase [Magnetococcales bacterium]|nr:riboflavin synthase [Magnetococcales bacterium]
MFTGLIEAVGVIRTVERSAAEWLLRVDCGFAGVKLGDSIAVSGVCLTVVEVIQAGGFAVQVSEATLQVSTLGNLSPGARVNLERALCLGGRLDGHLVQGHVDAIGLVERIAPRGRSLETWFRVPATVGRYIIPKGSIAIDGVSLTVNAVMDAGEESRFSINLIPHTQRETTLSALTPGGRVNVESDLLGRYVERLLARGATCGQERERRGGLDEAFLRQQGF